MLTFLDSQYINLFKFNLLCKPSRKKIIQSLFKYCINFPVLFELKRAYWISSNSSFIQYCDSNIGLFSIAPPLVIALPILRSYTLLKAIAKSKGKIIAPPRS